MSVKLLTEHHLEFLSLKEGCTGSSESTLVKMPHCWKSHAVAHLMTMLKSEAQAGYRAASGRRFVAIVVLFFCGPVKSSFWYLLDFFLPSEISLSLLHVFRFSI